MGNNSALRMDLQAILAGLQQQQGGGGGEPAAASSVQLRAGTMKRVGRTVTADKEKGTVRVFKDANQLTHFTWKERTKQADKLDLMLFPGDAEVFPLPRPPASGRCFALRLKDANRMHFFWMQEPSEDKDAKFYEDMNRLLGSTTPTPADAAPQVSAPDVAPAADDQLEEGLNDDDAAALQAALAMSMQDDQPAAPPAAPQRPAAPPAAAVSPVPAGDDEEDAALQAALAMSMQMDVDEPAGDAAASSSAVDQQMEGVDDDDDEAALQAALAMSMGEDPPAAPAAPAAVPALDAAAMERMRNLIANIKVPGGQGGGNVSAGYSQAGLDLSSVLDPDQISAAVMDPQVQQQLMEHLPEELRSPHEVAELVRSPQFQQALDGISHALSGQQMYQVLQSMGIDPSAAQQPGLEGFYGALIAHAASQAEPIAAAPTAEEPPEDDSDLYD